MKQHLINSLVTFIVILLCMLGVVWLVCMSSSVASGAVQSNTVAGFVYENTACDGIKNPISGYSVIVYRNEQFDSVAVTALGGLYSVDNLDPHVNYRFVFATGDIDNPIVRNIRFSGAGDFSRVDVNLAKCELYMPVIQPGVPSK